MEVSGLGVAAVVEVGVLGVEAVEEEGVGGVASVEEEEEEEEEAVPSAGADGPSLSATRAMTRVGSTRKWRSWARVSAACVAISVFLIVSGIPSFSSCVGAPIGASCVPPLSPPPPPPPPPEEASAVAVDGGVAEEAAEGSAGGF